MISKVFAMIICLKDNIFSILRKNHFSNFEMIMMLLSNTMICAAISLVLVPECVAIPRDCRLRSPQVDSRATHEAPLAHG